MRDVMRSKQHMRLLAGVLCRDLLTETVVYIHAWRDYLRELNSLQKAGRRCEYRWFTFQVSSKLLSRVNVVSSRACSCSAQYTARSPT